MLHLERRKLALKGACRPARFDLRLQLFHLALERPSLRVGLRHPQDFRQAHSSGPGRRLELAFAIVLLPLREHERMDVQRVSHVLRLDLRVIGQLDRLNLELKRIAMNLLRPNWCCHDTSSIVRSRCPLYRMRFPRPLDWPVMRHLRTHSGTLPFAAVTLAVHVMRPDASAGEQACMRALSTSTSAGGIALNFGAILDVSELVAQRSSKSS